MQQTRGNNKGRGGIVAEPTSLIASGTKFECKKACHSLKPSSFQYIWVGWGSKCSRYRVYMPKGILMYGIGR